MMQKFFSQEIRFKDDEKCDFPNWKEYSFGDLYDFRVTNSLSRDDLNYIEGKVRNIHYGDIHTKFSSSFHIEQEQVPFINPDKDISRISSENYCQVGDVVIADASEDYNDIGKAIEIMDLSDQPTLAGLHTLLARKKGSVLYAGYSGHMLKFYPVRKQIMRLAQGTKVLGITTGRMKSIHVPIPSIEEQKKLVDFLSALGAKTDLIEVELEKMRNFKKGLLQKMFV